jgi:hypothetical protein
MGNVFDRSVEYGELCGTIRNRQGARPHGATSASAALKMFFVDVRVELLQRRRTKSLQDTRGIAQREARRAVPG